MAIHLFFRFMIPAMLDIHYTMYSEVSQGAFRFPICSRANKRTENLVKSGFPFSSVIKNWRREWDSNPRWVLKPTFDFESSALDQLSHLSA